MVHIKSIVKLYLLTVTPANLSTSAYVPHCPWTDVFRFLRDEILIYSCSLFLSDKTLLGYLVVITEQC